MDQTTRESPDLTARSMDELRSAYQSECVAEYYDEERFSGLAGRTFNLCEQLAIRRALREASGAVRHRRVLDVACGTGRITQLLLSLGWNVTAGDVSSAMLRVAARRVHAQRMSCEFQLLDTTNLSHPDGRFDLVTCVRFLQHLGPEDRVGVLRELSRVSRGLVLINIPFSSPYLQARRWLKRHLLGDTSRPSATRSDIQREIAEAGLRPYRQYFAAPGISEDLILLLKVSRKPQKWT